MASVSILGLPAIIILTSIVYLFLQNKFRVAIEFIPPLALFIACGLWLRESDANRKTVKPNPHNSKYNIIMIGSDTLRADRLESQYERNVAPFLRDLSTKGTYFSQCYVPCARTAPSLLSLLTGSWPHRFGVRDNFVTDEATHLDVETLPRLLKKQGYYTAALSDWCGADMAKFDLGFDYSDVPEDQWNIKMFIRQGPKDLRLFLSLFCRNRFGRYFLPEIYYLGGVPQTDELGREALHLINDLAAQNQPFFLNIFFSTTHGPFGSEYPFYTKFSDSDYSGESKFVMARLTDPWEIIRRQEEPREAFDLDQIINLYDGCVARFDKEVEKIVRHVNECGLMENTVIVVYSDHGMEFFEHNTWGQGNSALSDVSSRIPLIITTPHHTAGGTVSSPVRSIDISPTLLDLAGAKTESGNFDGTSLLPWLNNPHHNVELDVFVETGIWLTDLPGIPAGHLRYPKLLDMLTIQNYATGTISLKREYEDLVVRAKDRVLRKGKWKLVYQPMEVGYALKLFDVERDPTCETEIGALHPDVVHNLWILLSQWIGKERQLKGSENEFH